MQLGEDYADIKANIKMLTHRMDVIDTWFKDYAAVFNQMYPNVKIEAEGLMNYAGDMTTRLTTGMWGDVCFDYVGGLAPEPPPMSVDKNELESYFIPLGDKDALAALYKGELLENYAYNGKVYGVPSMANAQGIVYNKKVLAKSGAKTPTTPDEFIAALQAIKDNTDAIPLYTLLRRGRLDNGGVGCLHRLLRNGRPRLYDEGHCEGE